VAEIIEAHGWVTSSVKCTYPTLFLDDLSTDSVIAIGH